MKSAIIILFLIFSMGSVLAQNTLLEINTDIEYQTIDNFGASDCWSFQKIGTWYTHKKEEIADLLFSQEYGIGLSAWRFNIGGGKGNNRISHPWRSVETFEISEGVYDWNRQSKESWFLHAAKDRGVDQFIAFVNSPPARMTKSGYTNCDDGLGSTNLKDGFENQYAKYLADILDHYEKDENIYFNYVSPVNEPFWEWNKSNQEGNRASNEDIRKIINALYDEFQTRSIDTEIMVPEAGNLPSWYSEISTISNKYGKTCGKYLNELVNDENVNTKISKAICGHSYWSDLINSELIQDRIELKIKLLPYFDKGWRYWMTEYNPMEGPNNEGGNGRDLTMETALNVARVIHYDLTITNASAWQWWTAVSPEDYKDGLIYTNYYNPGDNQTIILSKNLWVLGNYSRFIRPGSKRVECLGAADRNGIMASAYKDVKNDNLIIVAVNVMENSSKIDFNVSNLTEDIELTPYITSDESGDDLRMGQKFKISEGYTIPARSVVTFICKLENRTSIKTNNSIPSKTSLLQNYPNPFNPSTTLYYEIKERSKIKIEVFNISGQNIDILVNSVQPAGNYMIDFNPNSLSSGVYFARLSAKEFSNTIKMIYLR